MKDDKLNHWDMFILQMVPAIEESQMHTGGSFPLRIRRPSHARGEEVIFDIQYIHPTFGARSEELVLFRDGTWRFIPR